MIRVVLDTVIFVRSLINPLSWSGKILFQYSNTYRLFVSKPVLQEIFEVLKRPEVTSLFHTLDGLDKNRVIEIISQSEVVGIQDFPKISRDVKDDKFLATAQKANAAYLVTEDRDLLDLKEYKGTKIVDTATFLQILENDQE